MKPNCNMGHRLGGGSLVGRFGVHPEMDISWPEVRQPRGPGQKAARLEFALGVKDMLRKTCRKEEGACVKDMRCQRVHRVCHLTA